MCVEKTQNFQEPTVKIAHTISSRFWKPYPGGQTRRKQTMIWDPFRTWRYSWQRHSAANPLQSFLVQAASKLIAGEPFIKAPVEPLLPIEKKLIGWSLGLGIALLVVLIAVNHFVPIKL